MCNHGLVSRLRVSGFSFTSVHFMVYFEQVPATPACTWWNSQEEDPSFGKLESIHPFRTSVKSINVFMG